MCVVPVVDTIDITSLVGDLLMWFYFYLFILQSSNNHTKYTHVGAKNPTYNTILTHS